MSSRLPRARRVTPCLVLSLLLGLSIGCDTAADETIQSAPTDRIDSGAQGDGDTPGDGDTSGDGDTGDGDGDGDTGDGDEPVGPGDGDTGDGDTGDGDTGDGDAWPTPDAGEPDGEVDGWDPTYDAGTSDPDPLGDGGLPTGECRTLANNTNSGSFGTTGPVCFLVAAQPSTSWAGYFLDGRTVYVNGTQVSVGQVPFPGSAPFKVEFSAGDFDYASWAYW